MNPVFVRKRMSRDEMCASYPDKHFLVLDQDRGAGMHIGSLMAEAGVLTGYLLAVFDSSKEACAYSDEETKKAEDRVVLYSNDYTEEVYSLGFIFIIVKY